jgi:hypothetical protein
VIGNSLKGEGTRATNKFFRSSRHQSDISRNLNLVAPLDFSELRAPAVPVVYLKTDRSDAGCMVPAAA